MVIDILTQLKYNKLVFFSEKEKGVKLLRTLIKILVLVILYLIIIDDQD